MHIFKEMKITDKLIVYIYIIHWLQGTRQKLNICMVTFRLLVGWGYMYPTKTKYIVFPQIFI